MKELITAKQLAEKLQMSEKTIYRLRESGMPFKKIGKSFRFDPEEVTAWIEKETVNA